MTFKFTGTLIPNLNRFDAKANRAMVAAANFVSPQAEAYMKENATWTDQTGNARQGLRSQVEVAPDKVAIIMYHSVFYGVFLELRWGGKYAIIEPTMAHIGPLFTKAIKELLFD